jgi:hypothetical protein
MIKHISASAMQNYSECPSRYLTQYDPQFKMKKVNEKADVGSLVHATSEKFYMPGSEWDTTSLEQMLICFEQVCQEERFAESFAMYKFAKELCEKMFRMNTFHPKIPIQNKQILNIEQRLIDVDGNLFKHHSWALPCMGAIDELSIIAEVQDPTRLTLLLIDKKTGWASTKEELVTENIQCALYMLYCRLELVPILEAQGYTVTNILGLWEYIAQGTCVTIEEKEFNHQETIDYIKNISGQMVQTWTEYDKLEMSEKEKYLKSKEKQNKWCAWCHRKEVCSTFEKMMLYSSQVNLTGDVDWNKIWEEHEKYNTVKKYAEDRCKQINSVIRNWMQQERQERISLDSIGKDIKITHMQNKDYNNKKLAELLGIDFFIENASLTQEKINTLLKTLRLTNPTRAQEIEDSLPNTFHLVPGASYPKVVNQIKEKK